jgi:DNA-binding NtrC family response regulator
MTGAPARPARDYPRLFTAMNEVLRALAAGGDERDALRRSFEHAAEGFGAEKALLLLVEADQPLALRTLCARGLAAREIRACERGESVVGVSASVIRRVVAERGARVVPNPRLLQERDDTPALAGDGFSVLCAPVLDPLRDRVLAVLYFQNHAPAAPWAYGDPDAVWVEGYASALGRAFALYFQDAQRERELEALLQGAGRPEHAPDLVGDSAHTRTLRRLLHETYIPAAEAPDPDPLLILGEKGTGKDLVARYIHAWSARRDRPFVAVSGAEITDEMAAARLFGHKKGAFTGAVADEPGLFRAAHRGVLFLDEVGELSLRVQGTLLRVLENRTVVPVGETREVRVDVQVVLASNRDLERAAAEGLIKPDFLDRITTNVIQLQPLRERPWDVPALAQHFLAHHERRLRKKTLGPTADALRALVSYAWPGNVRELARVCSLLLTHARPGVPLDRDLVARCYPAAVTGGRNPRAAPVLGEDVPLREAVRAFERELILSRLERHAGDTRAARLSLGLPKTTFHRYLAALGITAARPEAEE